MDNKFKAFFKSLEDTTLIESTEKEKERIISLTNNKMPETFWDFYSKEMPDDDIEFGDFEFYGLERMIEENEDAVPGYIVMKYGLFVFASTFDGDGICFDMTKENFPVYQCSHSLIDEDEISYYKGKMCELETNYESIIKVSPLLANSFDEFIDMLIKDTVETYSVTEIIEGLDDEVE
ncbi:MAG: hypothetical protein Q4D51_09245 [Eubacteriales bacterium]|nr:hypothetical protein [Eubacteriales bacterium]